MHTAETTRVRFFMDKLIQLGKPVMLVGAAGSGKTVLMQDKLNNLMDESDDWMVANVPFNFYTTSAVLQVRPIFAFRPCFQASSLVNGDQNKDCSNFQCILSIYM